MKHRSVEDTWLLKMAETLPSEKDKEKQLSKELQRLPIEDIEELNYELSQDGEDPAEPPTPELDAMQDKVAQADRMGRELARAHGNKLQKQAFLGAIKPFATKALGWAAAHPTTAMAGLGAAGGAAMAGRDPMTGQKNYLSGAVKGGLVGGLVSRVGLKGGGTVGSQMGGAATKAMGGMGNVAGAAAPAAAAAGQAAGATQPGMWGRMKGMFGMGKAANFRTPVGRIKLAMSVSAGPDGSSDWLSTFEGTPFHTQAIELERQALQMEEEDIQKRQAEDQERQSQWSMRDMLNLHKRHLALDLAEQKAAEMGQGVGPPPEEEIPPEAMAEPPPEEIPPEMAAAAQGGAPPMAGASPVDQIKMAMMRKWAGG